MIANVETVGANVVFMIMCVRVCYVCKKNINIFVYLKNNYTFA